VEPDPDELPDELSLPELLPDDADAAGFAMPALTLAKLLCSPAAQCGSQGRVSRGE